MPGQETSGFDAVKQRKMAPMGPKKIIPELFALSVIFFLIER